MYIIDINDQNRNTYKDSQTNRQSIEQLSLLQNSFFTQISGGQDGERVGFDIVSLGPDKRRAVLARINSNVKGR